MSAHPPCESGLDDAASDSVRGDTLTRVPCPVCSAMIVAGALKCGSCRKWLVIPSERRSSRVQRSLTLLVATVVSCGALLLSGRGSVVGEAPPLTPLAAEGAASADGGEPDLAGALEADVEQLEAQPGDDAPARPWRARQLALDAHPLDLAFRADGKTVFVSTDDAKVREYDVATGKLLRRTGVPAQGDRLRMLHGRYLAVLRHTDAAWIPIVDAEDRDAAPMLLHVGKNPADILALPDGRSVVAASSEGKQLTWYDLSNGQRRADIKLPHATRHLFLLQAHGRHYVGAMGRMFRSGRSAGAWLDLFDPSERPFGATRRSIAVGSDPRPGAVTSDLTSIFFADHAANSAVLLRLDDKSGPRTVSVGQGPEAGFVMGGDRYGVTLDSKARTATVVDLKTMTRLHTIMLQGSPRTAAVTSDGSRMFVSLGGVTWPPSGSGAAVIGGDPPGLIELLPTGHGASRVAVSNDGERAAVANYYAKAITFVER